jgi:hypothetical protein
MTTTATTLTQPRTMDGLLLVPPLGHDELLVLTHAHTRTQS